MAAILVLSTLLSLSTITLSLSKNINHIIIDCGESSESEVKKGFIKGGKSYTTSSGNWPDKTLRAFPSGAGKCYINIPATSGRKTLVKTVFNYANYDNKSSSPSFFVLYDKKHYEKVEFDQDQLFKSEVIFTPASKEISVCLIRTSLSDDPFISSIEVYDVDDTDGMYNDLKPDEGLILIHRLAFGAKTLISDSYGRMWDPIGPANKKISELTSTTSIDITDASNKPPEVVMSNALSADGFKLLEKTLASLAGMKVYLALYFSEPKNLEGTQKRTFNVFLDKKRTVNVSGPIVPIFGKATQVVINRILPNSSQLIFQSTKDSDLPPIINALELYLVHNGTPGGEIDWKKIFKIVKSQSDSESDENEDQQLVLDLIEKGFELEEERKKWVKALEAAKAVKATDAMNVGQLASSTTRMQKIRIIAVSVTVPTVALLSAVIFIARSKKANPQSSTAPGVMSEGSGAEAGESSLVGKKLASNASQPGQDKPARV